MKTLLALLLLGGSANALPDFVYVKQSNLDKLNAELAAGGITHSGTSCGAGFKCTIFNPRADPSAIVAAHVYTDPKAPSDIVKAQAIALAKTLKALPEPIDPVERDTRRLLLRLCYLLLSTDQ